MDTLPTEVISDIFYETIEKDHKDHSSLPCWRKYETDVTPLRLSSVCRSWRTLALSFGKLWSHLALKFDAIRARAWDSEPQKPGELLKLFEMWLRRTNGCPLNFSILIEDGFMQPPIRNKAEWGEVTRMANYIVKSMLSQRHRWRVVEFDWSCLYPPFQDIRADSMPLLRSLSATFFLKDGEERSIPIVIDVAKSSVLRRLRIDGRFFLRFGEGPVHTLMETSSLDFSMDPEEGWSTTCLDLLKFAPHLKELHIKAPPSEEVWVDPVYETHDLIQSNLWSLKITRNLVPLLMRKVSLPSLKALSVMQYSHTALLCFIRHFTPALTFLEIDAERMDRQQWIETLPLLPDLRTLWTGFYTVMEVPPFLDLLTLSTEDDIPFYPTSGDGECRNRILCPLLNSLFVKSPRIEEHGACIRPICDMLESRHRVLGTFQRINFWGRRQAIDMPFSPEDYGAMDFLFDEKGWFHAEGDDVEPYPFHL